MRREGFLVVALSAALCGCSGEVQEQPAAAADYEGSAAVIAQLDEVQSYRVSTVSTDEDYGEDYAYEERSETTVSVGEEGDSASETTMSYHVYEDGTSKDVTCSSSELEGSGQEESCALVHSYENGVRTYSDGYEDETAQRMSQQYFMMMDNLEDAQFTLEGDTWTISGESDAGNVYTATLRVDEEGMPKTFIYSYDSLGLSMERTISDIVR